MYTLDTAAAKQADDHSKFIRETGKYKGKFTKAEALTASSGTTGVAFSFVSDSGQEANFSIYVQKSNGEKLPAYKTLNSIMACLRLRNVSAPVQCKTKKYDFKQKKEIEYEAPLLLDLMNKQIGVVLQNCEYEKEVDRRPTGEYGWKIELQGAFESSSELTASEILEGKTTPEKLSAIIANLSDRPLKNKKQHSSNDQQVPAHFDDDIPF